MKTSCMYYIRLVFFFTLSVFPLQASTPDSAVPTDERVVMLFAGDVMGHGPQIKAAYDSVLKTFDYSPCFRLLKPYIEQADIAIANLEVTLAGLPYAGYPQFSSPDELADGLKEAGFDVLITANNHCVDRGKAGLERTLEVIAKRGFKFAGTYANQAQKDSLYPLLLTENNTRIALLNYTYGTNGNPVTAPNIVNRIDTAAFTRDLAKAKNMYPDVIVATIHWGEEYQLAQNAFQERIASDLLKKGVDFIIGSHPHVVQPIIYETYPDSSIRNLVAYSLGNFISNQRERYKNGGIMVEVVYNRTARKVESVQYIPVYVHRGELEGKYQYHLIPTPLALSNDSAIALPADAKELLKQFDQDTRKQLENVPVSTFYTPTAN